MVGRSRPAFQERTQRWRQIFVRPSCGVIFDSDVRLLRTEERNQTSVRNSSLASCRTDIRSMDCPSRTENSVSSGGRGLLSELRPL